MSNPQIQTLKNPIEPTPPPKDSQPVTGDSETELEDIGDEELEKLEKETQEMANKILDFRANLPDQLKTTLTSILASHRPRVPDIDARLGPGLDRESNADSGEQGTSSQPALSTIRDQKTAEKLRLLKDRISRNISAMPNVINRVKECISRIENNEIENNDIIHPAVKKKRTS
ncbi:hypothetical protein M5689_004868 [Euphorbia peplus]|nr:hypothetical protein M5689_004868 [Euphorbia peplus]